MGGDGASAEAGDSPVLVTINIRCSNGTKFTVQSSLDATIGSFKEVVAGACSVPAERQRLIYKGRILKDDQTLRSYGLESDHTIHLVRGAAPSASPTAPKSAGVNPGVSTDENNANETGSRTLGSNEGSGLGGSPFPGLGVLGSGANGLFGANSELPEIDQVHQQLARNPNMMRDIMNMPVVQNLMNNPDLMRNLIMNNPQMREIIDRNPDLAHILNDPSILRQTLEAARNPELMREMMRNTDRAMSNIESSPEGFNMLRRMYETVQEPFLNASTASGESGNILGSNPFSALLGNQGTQVRDAANPSTTGSEAAAGSPAPNTSPLPNPWSNPTGTGQNNSTRPSPATGDTRSTGISGLGGLDMERLFGGSQDTSPFGRIMENPVMRQMMQSLLSNPQYMNQIINSVDPSNLLGSNAQLREMLQNPEFLQQLTSPETLQQLRAFQQSLFGLQQQGREQNQAGGTDTDTPNTGLEFLMNMFGGLGGAGGMGIPNTNVPPEELYATQLAQLQEMGFFDTQENIRALSATAGNVHAAVERLLGNLGQ